MSGASQERLGALLKTLFTSFSLSNSTSKIVFNISFVNGEQPTTLQFEDFDDPFNTSITSISIGDMSKTRVLPFPHPELIPFKIPSIKGTICTIENQEIIKHLRWMLQKDNLRQDMFLIGPPGPLKRWLALLYCQLVGREVEYISLSRDTTESDLKQRYII